VDAGKKLLSAPKAPLEDRFGDLVGLNSPKNLSFYLTSWDRTVAAAPGPGSDGTRVPMAQESPYMKVDGSAYTQSVELGVPADFSGGNDPSYTYSDDTFQKAHDPPNQGIPRYDRPLEQSGEHAVTHVDGDIYNLVSQARNVKETYSSNSDHQLQRQRRIDAGRPYDSPSSRAAGGTGGAVYINSAPAYPWFTQFGGDNYAQGIATNPYFSPYSFPYPYSSNPNLQPWDYPNLNPYPYSFIDPRASPYFPSRTDEYREFPPLTEIEPSSPIAKVANHFRKPRNKRHRSNSALGWGLGGAALVILFILLVVVTGEALAKSKKAT